MKASATTLSTWSRPELSASYTKSKTRKECVKSEFSNITRAGVSCRRKLSDKGVVSVLTTTEVDAPLAEARTKESFNWLKHWWPVQFTYNLDTDRPNRIQLLGEFFVVWKSKAGEWVAMKDMCPHRMAPLSEGRVEDDGTLMCSYHGWRFNECGKCVKIPQADDEKSQETACSSPRSVAKTFPCKAAAACLWLWPDTSETAFEYAEKTSLPIPNDFSDAVQRMLDAGLKPGYTRTVPYNIDVLTENMLDPSHFPVAHHKVFRATREMAGPLKMRFEQPVLSPDSIAAATFSSMLGSRTWIEFAPPHQVVYQFGDMKSPFGSRTFIFAIPISSGKSRILNLEVSSKNLHSKSGNVSSDLIKRFFPWLPHMSVFPVTDGVNMLLHERDKHLQHLQPKGWKPSTYFTPTSADMMVLTYRRWLSDVNGRPQMLEDVDHSMRRSQVLDRYDSHVAQCKICQEGLTFLKQIGTYLKIVSASALIVALGFAAQSMQGALSYWKVALPLVLWIAVSLFEKHLQTKIISHFYFVDYVHAEKD